MTILSTILRTAFVLSLTAGSSAMADGDRDYGEYLASHCATCHRPGATDAKIPSIAGMDQSDFGDLMKAYRSGARENAIMQTVAKGLTDEDIAALAAYFASLEPAE